MPWKRILLATLLALGSGGCRAGGSLQMTSSAPVWDDGSYIGVYNLPTPQLIQVAVDISSGRMVAIRVLQHPAWHIAQEQDKILRLVVESQTTAGHAARDTGSEQDRLLHAIEDALAKAQSVIPAAP